MLFLYLVDRGSKRRQVKPLADSLLDALDYDSSDDSDFEVGDASGKKKTDGYIYIYTSFPVAQMVEHGASNTKIMGSIPRESKS